MTKAVPYFPLYAANILAARPFKLMSLKERGLWITMQMECWVNKTIPSDSVELAKYLGVPITELEDGLTDYQFSFIEKVQGELISPELSEYQRQFEEKREKQRLGGLKGAERKKLKNLKEKASITEGTPKGQPKGSLSYLNSTSIRLNSLKSNQLADMKEMSPENAAWVKEYDEN